MIDAPFKTFLNAGAGLHGGGRPHSAFEAAGWREVTLDIDPSTRPEIVSSIHDMRANVSDGRFDAVWSSHTIEHLHAHEVIPAFREFRRVLKSDGFALLTCPDLTAIARLAAEGDVERVVYLSPAGPIRVIDMIFGYGSAIAEGHLAMAHNTGFTAQRLARVALAAGFSEVRVIEGDHCDLWAAALGPDADLRELSRMFRGADIAELFEGDRDDPTRLEAPGRAARAS
jgi:SAM-dependent methyltransferase